MLTIAALDCQRRLIIARMPAQLAKIRGEVTGARRADSLCTSFLSGVRILSNPRFVADDECDSATSSMLQGAASDDNGNI